MGSVRGVIGRLVVLATAAFVVAAPAVAQAQEPCAASAGFSGVSPSGAGPRAVRVDFGRRQALPVNVDVFAVSRGRRVVGSRLVARFTGRAGSFVWDGRDRDGRVVGEGYYVMRFAMLREGRAIDVRRVALRRTRSGFERRPAFERPASCDLLSTFRLARPVFGGERETPLSLTVRLDADARVRIIVTRVGGQVVSRQDPVARSGRRTYRITLPAGELRPGDYRVRLEAVGGADRVTATLTAHRL